MSLSSSLDQKAAGNTATETRVYIAWIDLVRFVACILVVLLHVSGPFIDATSMLSYLSVAGLVEAASRCSVPLFFMIVGFLTFETEARRSQRNLGKKIARGLVPLAFYTLVYAALCWAEGLTIQNPFKEPVFYHLWFLYCYPINAVLLALARPPSIRPEIGVFASGALIIIISAIFRNLTNNHALLLISQQISFYLFSLFGFYIWRTRSNPALQIICFACYCFASFATAYLTSYYSSKAGYLDQTFYQYDMPLIVLQAAAIAYVIKNSHLLAAENILIRNVSRYSLGIYCIHPLVLFFALKLFEGVKGEYYLAIISCLAFSWFGAFVIRRAPFGKWLA